MADTTQEKRQHLLMYDDGDFEDTGTNFSEEGRVIRAVNKALHGAAHLNNLLPTGTLLAFQLLCPIVSNGGFCDTLHRWLTVGLLGSCGLWSFVLVFTDTIRSPDDGKVYYGLATPHGLWTFGGRNRNPYMDTYKYRVRYLDFFHGLLSALVVASLGLSNFDVVDCFYPQMPRVYMNIVPVVAGFVISLLFIVFPSRRRGIVHPVMFGSESLQTWY